MNDIIVETAYWTEQLNIDCEKAEKYCEKFWEGPIGFDLEDQIRTRNLLVDFRAHVSLLNDEVTRLQAEAAKPFWKKLFRK